MKLVAIDFETANASSASACSLGIFVYEDGEIKENYDWFIKPARKYNFFTNTCIHGITEADVSDEKEFYEYYEELKEILKDGLIVAHNAPFDIGVLNAVCDVYGLDHFDNEYIDTVQVSRRVYPELYNHKLNTVCEYLDISLDHHKASSDSFACLMILLLSMQLRGMEDVYEFADSLKIKIKRNR